MRPSSRASLPGGLPGGKARGLEPRPDRPEPLLQIALGWPRSPQQALPHQTLRGVSTSRLGCWRRPRADLRRRPGPTRRHHSLPLRVPPAPPSRVCRAHRRSSGVPGPASRRGNLRGEGQGKGEPLRRGPSPSCEHCQRGKVGRDLPGTPQPNPTPGGTLGLAWKSTLPFRTKADTESNGHKAGCGQLLEEGRAGAWRREHLVRRGPGAWKDGRQGWWRRWGVASLPPHHPLPSSPAPAPPPKPQVPLDFTALTQSVLTSPQAQLASTSLPRGLLFPLLPQVQTS